MKEIRGIISLATIFALVGCLHDDPQPLTRVMVEAALAEPTADILNDRIQRLRHPLLHATDLRLDRPLTPSEVSVLAVLLNPSLQAERRSRRWRMRKRCKRPSFPIPA